MCTAIVAFVFLLFSSCEGKRYTNYVMLRGVPYDYKELNFLKKMDQMYNISWWKKPTLVHNAAEFSIAPRSLAKLYRDTETMTIRFTVMLKNIQSAFDKQKASHYIRRNMQSFNWHSYYRLDDIYDWLKDLSIQHPTEVQLHRLGRTRENRTILGARLILQGSHKRSKVIVEGGCHAREWISPAFVTYMLFTLLNAKDYKDAELERIAYMYIWIFVPVMNPDGYEYSHTTDRLWRKNRRDGVGVDLNRNFGIAFRSHGTSTIPDHMEYSGDIPFSEPETYAMAALAITHRRTLEYYLSFHAYGQYVIIPYSHLIEHENNFNEVKNLADKMVTRMTENHGVQYKIGTSFDTVGYLASGVSIDWVKRALNTSYVVSIELPDTGVHGFALPPGKILPTCQATMDGLLAFLAPQSPAFMRSNATQRHLVFIEIVLCSLVLCVVNRFAIKCT